MGSACLAGFSWPFTCRALLSNILLYDSMILLANDTLRLQQSNSFFRVSDKLGEHSYNYDRYDGDGLFTSNTPNQGSIKFDGLRPPPHTSSLHDNHSTSSCVVHVDLPSRALFCLRYLDIVVSSILLAPTCSLHRLCPCRGYAPAQCIN